MKEFEAYLESIKEASHRQKMMELLSWVLKTFPDLKPKIAWNQPMFTHHDTFIIGFSQSKKHIAFAPERVTTERFSKDIQASGYEHTSEIVRIPWTLPIDYPLLEKIIQFNIEDKKNCQTFWRK